MQFTLNLTTYQVRKLTEYFLDISKGLLLMGFSLPLVTSSPEVFLGLKVSVSTIFFLFLSLELGQGIHD
jgi:hypothetical protein